MLAGNASSVHSGTAQSWEALQSLAVTGVALHPPFCSALSVSTGGMAAEHIQTMLFRKCCVLMSLKCLVPGPMRNFPKSTSKSGEVEFSMSESGEVKFPLKQAALWVQSPPSCVTHGSCVISTICRVGVWWSLGQNVCVTQQGSVAVPHSAAVLSSWLSGAAS